LDIEISPAGSAVYLQQKHVHTAATAAKPAAVLISNDTIQIYPQSVQGAVLDYVKKAAGTTWNTDSICYEDLL
jgi:TRAP-type C4-dicarboxylate transport system substrate-binding protein